MSAKRKTKKNIALAPLLLLVVALYFFFFEKEEEENQPHLNVVPTSAIEVQYIDVGQADCQLIKLPDGKTMLIDAGNNPDGKLIVEYLEKQNIKKIDYLVATHPHEDHIGGIDNIIENFEIGTVYMPEISTDDMPTTKTYEDVLNAIVYHDVELKKAEGGLTICDSDGLLIKILSPNSTNYGDMNTYSAVVKVDYCKNSFLFMGDAEEFSEHEIMNKGFNVKADVLKLGHHGSSTSTCTEFLNKVKPSTLIISCGKDNKYGHPHRETMDMIAKNNFDYYRTDKDGTIIAKGDGETITFTTSNVSCEGNT